ncbi:exodeoxyribonuclease III [Gammaproteobacteria bacterium]
MCTVATWNVNSLRARLPHVLDWLRDHSPEVLALQETKVPDSAFPTLDLQAAGYHLLYSGQPSYNGVALLSRSAPSDVQIGIPEFQDPQRRVLAALYDAPDLPGGKLRVINLYVPNGREVNSEPYFYKLDWLARIAQWLKQELEKYPNVAVVGDYNIAPEDQDVYDPAVWVGKIAVSDLERAAFKDLLSLGLYDAFRFFTQAPREFTWWSYQASSFPRNLGLRIDHILMSQSLADRCSICYIDRTPRGWDRPSDHTPIVVKFRNR